MADRGNLRRTMPTKKREPKPPRTKLEMRIAALEAMVRNDTPERKHGHALVQKINVLTEVELLLRGQPEAGRALTVLVQRLDEPDDWWTERSHWTIEAWARRALSVDPRSGVRLAAGRMANEGPGTAYG